MREGDLAVLDLEQAGVLALLEGSGARAAGPRDHPHRPGVGGRGQHERPPRLLRETARLRGEDSLEALADGHRMRERHGALQLLAAQASGELEERERIPPGCRDELGGDLRRDAHVRIVVQQQDGGLRVEAPELELRNPACGRPCLGPRRA